MTCIVGLRADNKVYIAGDSSAVELDNHYSEVWNTKKVFTAGDFLFGYCGSFRIGQLIQYVLKIPKYSSSSLEEYLVKDFIPAFQKLLAKEEIKDKDWEILIGYKDQLYTIDGEFSVGEPKDPYIAIGYGRDYALGAMFLLHSLSVKDLSIQDQLKLALTSATRYTNTVREPFVILST